MRKLVKLTQEHIDNGERQSCPRCPVALAINDSLKDTWSFVGVGSATVLGKHVKLSKKATEFIKAFDRYEEVEPFNFYLTLPDNLVQ